MSDVKVYSFHTGKETWNGLEEKVIVQSVHKIEERQQKCRYGSDSD